MADWEGYEIEGRLGMGTTGTVWLARQLSLGRQVALKELAADLGGDDAVRGRLRHQAQVLGCLEHPNCVAIYTYLESSSAAAIVMEYVEGVSLRILAATNHLSVEQALIVLEGALEGLAYAHSQDIVHGDVKPENILLATTGESKLVDFGLATAIGTGRAPGTGSPAYSSPEAAAGLPLGVASDLYSAGLVLPELLTGVVPLGGAAVPGVDPEAGSVSAPVAALVRRALDPDPAVRPVSATAFLEEIRLAAAQGCGQDGRRRAVLVPLVVAAAAAVGVTKASAATSAPIGRARARTKSRRLLSTHLWAAVVVLAAAVCLGCTATKPRNTSASTAKTAPVALRSATAASTPATTGLSTTTTPPAMSATAVTQFVTAFYNAYSACHGGRGGTSCPSDVVKEYGTANLDSNYTAPAGYVYPADPITCVDALPDGVEVSDVTLTPNSASGTVTEAFAQPTAVRFVVVDQSGTLKIDTITCNPPLTPSRPLGSGAGATGSSGTTLDGTYTISLPPGNVGCGFPGLNAEILTVNGTTASITPTSGGNPYTGKATITGSTFSMHITNGITNAPGAIAIDLTGNIQPNGNLSGQSVNSGIYPGGTNGFGCDSPFTATRTSGSTAPPNPVTTPPTGQSTGNLQLPPGGEFLSPTRNLGCELDYGSTRDPDRVYCQSNTPPQSVTMSADGSFKTCTGTNCVGNAGQGTPSLSYGATATGGPFTCVSATSGITCTASGKGFEISRTGVTAVP